MLQVEKNLLKRAKPEEASPIQHKDCIAIDLSKALLKLFD